MKDRGARESKTMVDISQVRIRSKINSYLSQQKRPAKLLRAFTKGHGYCHGLAVLVAYAQYLEYIQIKHPSTQPMDDWKWLKATLNTLSCWDENLNALSGETIADIERFIGHIYFIQHVSKYLSIGQGSLHLYLDDTAQRQIKLEYTLAGLFTAKDFTQALDLQQNQKTNLINVLTQYQRRIIIISCGNHSLSLFRSGSVITLYNANHKSGLQKYSTRHPELLVRAIFKSYKFTNKNPSPIGFRIFTFDNKLASYPEQQIILKQLNPPLLSKLQEREIDYSALHIATRIGSTECVSHYLDNGAELDSTMARMRTSLHIAASRNYTSIAEILIAKNADINKQLDKHSSPLIRACEKSHIHIVKLMLDHPANASFENLLTVLSHLNSHKSRHYLINKLNKTTLRQMMNDRFHAETVLQQYKSSDKYNKKIHSLLVCLLHTHSFSGQLMVTKYDFTFFSMNQNKHPYRQLDKSENMKDENSTAMGKYAML